MRREQGSHDQQNRNRTKNYSIDVSLIQKKKEKKSTGWRNQKSLT
jgi:hypothetical protein